MKKTTWLRYVGASIMGILDPSPSAVPSPMTVQEGVWVRTNAWTKALRKIDDAYPHGFHRWCSCEAGTCHPCSTGHHDQCVSARGPRVDEHAGTITDRGGFVVAVIRYGPDQRPCRWNCPCTHPAAVKKTTDTSKAGQPPATQLAVPAHRAAPGPEGQLTLFVSGPEELRDGEAPHSPSPPDGMPSCAPTPTTHSSTHWS